MAGLKFGAMGRNALGPVISMNPPMLDILKEYKSQALTQQ